MYGKKSRCREAFDIKGYTRPSDEEVNDKIYLFSFDLADLILALERDRKTNL